MNTKTTILRTFVTFALSAIIILCASFTGAEKKANQQLAIEAKYYTSVNGQHIVLVEFDNLSQDKIVFLLKDEEGTVLYTEDFNGKKFSKKFLFEMPDVSNHTFSVEVLSSKKATQYDFIIKPLTNNAAEIISK